jgi:hypothetical protein
MTKKTIFLSYLFGKGFIGFSYDTAEKFLDKLNLMDEFGRAHYNVFLKGSFLITVYTNYLMSVFQCHI